MESNANPAPSKTNPIKVAIPLIGVLALVCIALVLSFKAYRLMNNNDLVAQSGTVEVVLTRSGYQPEVVIRKGTTVIFKNELDKPYWPASNLHPSHEIYSDFDPKRPLAPEETWSFRFDRVGIWDMHDHIRSYYTGRITVVD